MNKEYYLLKADFERSKLTDIDIDYKQVLDRVFELVEEGNLDNSSLKEDVEDLIEDFIEAAK